MLRVSLSNQVCLAGVLPYRDDYVLIKTIHTDLPFHNMNRFVLIACMIILIILELQTCNLFPIDTKLLWLSLDKPTRLSPYHIKDEVDTMKGSDITTANNFYPAPNPPGL